MRGALTVEVWKDVVGYEGIYEVSSKGRVKSVEGKITYTKRHGKRVWKERVLKEKNPNGRDVRVTLWSEGQHEDFLVHRLVGMAFIANPEGKPAINHKDGNPRNNHVDNLEWVTYEENQNHAFDNGLVNTNIKVALKCTTTNKSHTFRSMARGSEFLGRSPGYISGRLLKGKEKMNAIDGKEYKLV